MSGIFRRDLYANEFNESFGRVVALSFYPFLL